MRLLFGILLVLACFAIGAAYRFGFETTPPEIAVQTPKPVGPPVGLPEAASDPRPAAAARQPGRMTVVRSEPVPPALSERLAERLAALAPEAGTRDAAEAPSGETMEPVRRDVRDVTPDHVLPGPRIEAEMIRRLPAATPPPKPQPEKPVSWPRVAVLSAGTLRSGGTTITLAGIEPLAADAECRTPDGAAWPCGNFARAATQRLIRGRPVQCDPAAATADDALVSRCRVSGRDIGLWLVERGWALPKESDDPQSDYGQALALARQTGRGQWRRDDPLRLQARALPRPGVDEPVIPDFDPGQAAPPDGSTEEQAGGTDQGF